MENQNLNETQSLNRNHQKRTYKRITAEVKQLAISFIQRNPGKSIAEAARDLSLSERHLRKIYAQFQKDGLPGEDIRGGPRNIKVQEIHRNRIEMYIEENPAITLAQIKLKLQEDFNLTISIATVIRAIKRLKITYKLVRLVPLARNTPEVIEARFVYGQTYFDRRDIRGRDRFQLTYPKKLWPDSKRTTCKHHCGKFEGSKH
ncbi:hypothetical protein RF11_07333 [Thelohanellus kitauei]|uniref:Transposase Tc1-like domain-containing protein n=1 Tax=Thelohanellus kitauei TaxID=669202 RepID=A0A0C2MKH2_THEKT|nr:hypothetical protein RF11_07333 [Thelohanellus kitauei]